MDRRGESDLLKAALADLRRSLDGDDDGSTARRNVVAFHGLGGIGKTALSERLDRWMRYDLPPDNGWGPPPQTKVDATTRIDLHGSAGYMNLVDALLAIRGGAMRLRRRWPVFDLAFAAYWSAIRPGEALPQSRGNDGLADSVADTAGDALADFGESLHLVGAGTGAGVAVEGVRAIVRELGRRRDLRLALDSFDGFEYFLRRCALEPSSADPRPDLACQLAQVLAWELSRIAPVPLMVVFIDTTERLLLDPRRVSEADLNRLIHNMPNVLFVMTGRDSLDWWDAARIDLTHRGPTVWPGLQPGHEHSRQRPVGNLSEADRKAVIIAGRRRLGLQMSDDVVEELARASAGLPQYLELALQVATTVAESEDGREIRASDVTGSLGSLVMRVLDGIPADEQRALRAACLFRIFDTRLIAAAAEVDHGCAERAVLRPMVDRLSPGEPFPFRMHDAIRDAIRQVDSRVAGGWSESDWEAASDRAAEAARALHDAAKRRKDNRAALDAVGIAITLACEQTTYIGPSETEAYADWLTRAIVYGPSIQGLRARIPGKSRTEYGRHVLNFVAGKLVDTPVAERLRLLRETFDADHPLSIPAGRHLGYALRQLYQWDEALSVFEEVAEARPSAVNQRQVPLTLSMARRFVDARELARGNSAEESIQRIAEYTHGLPERYFREVPPKLKRLEDGQRIREHVEEEGDFLLRRALLRGVVSSGEISAYQERADLSGHGVGIRSGLLAEVLARHSGRDRLRAVLEQLKALDFASGAPDVIGFRYALGELCDAYVEDDATRLRRLLEETNALQVRSRSWIPVECMFRAIGMRPSFVPTQWLDDEDVVVQRWAGHLAAYVGRTRK